MKNKIYLIAALLFILKTTALAQWSNIWTNYNIHAICFARNADTCFVTGSGGKIYRTTNGGSTWDSAQTVFTTSWFNDIYFPSANIGYACGGTAFGNHPCMIAKTTNGGQTWDSVLSNGFSYEFYKIFFVNDSVGYCGGDYFVKTTDGGQTFSIITLPVPGLINAIYFFDDTVGLISTYQYVNASKALYRIERTTDGGLNWTTRYIDSSNNVVTIYGSKRINDIYFTNSSDGYAVADNGIYLKSSNGGLNWSATQLLNDSTHFKDIAMSKTTGVGYIACWKYDNIAFNYEGSIYKTGDAGFSWQQNFDFSFDGFYSVSMADGDTVYAAGYGNIFKTNNGGATFIHEAINKEDYPTLFPNPASDEFRIQNGKFKLSDIEIYNVLGQKIFFENKQNVTEIIVDVSNWNAGLYLVKVNDAKRQYSQKIIVQ